MQKIGASYDATVASKLDALDAKYNDDVVVIKSAFRQLQKTKDVKEADRLIPKLSLLLTDVSDISHDVSTLDEENVSSVARALRNLEAQKQE